MYQAAGLTLSNTAKPGLKLVLRSDLLGADLAAGSRGVRIAALLGRQRTLGNEFGEQVSNANEKIPMVAIWNFSSLLELSDHNSGVNRASLGEVQNRGTREIWFHTSYEGLELVLRDQPLAGLPIRMFLHFGGSVLRVIANQLCVQTLLVFHNMNEFMHEREPKPVDAVISER